MIFIAGPYFMSHQQASGVPGSLPAQGRGEPTPRSRALPCDQGWRYVPVYTRNPLFAFFSFFAARFSIRLLAGFFFASFFVSIALLITGSSDWREQLAFCDKVSRSGSLENRPIPSKPHAGGAAVRTPAQRGRLLTRAGFQGLWLCHGDSQREHRDLKSRPVVPHIRESDG